MELARADPCLTHEIIADWLLPDEFKVEMVKKFITEGSTIGLFEGDRGEGKTYTAHSFAEMMLEAGRRPYWVGPPQALPDDFGRVIDPYDVPQGGVAVTDEAAIKYSARRSGSNIDDLQILLTLRHTNRSSIFMSQLSSLADVNLPRMANYFVFKPLSLLGRKLERDVIGSVVPEEFVPRDKYYTHFFCKSFRTTFRQPQAKRWKEDFSYPFAQVTEENVHAFVTDLLTDGFTPDGMIQELKARSYRIDKNKLKEIINGIRR
jgi:hypothetical protein